LLSLLELGGANVRMEQRLDGSLAVRHGSRYLPVSECAVADKSKPARPAKTAKPAKKKSRKGARGSDWNKDFDLKKSPPMWQAAQASGNRKNQTI
jgi:hypothetical protein